MKKILLFLLLPLVLFGQSNIPKFERAKKSPQYSISLDGSTEYASKTSPTGLDLNGAERIPDSSRTFETSVGAWTGAGNHSVSRNTTYKKTGTASMALISSAAGDTSSNYGQLPGTALTATEAGKKYTLEIWGKDKFYTGDTLKIYHGDQLKKITFADTSFGKKVWNFLETTAGVGKGFKFVLNKADTVYIDDVSLTQAKDVLVLGWWKFNSIETGDERLLYLANASGYARFSVYESSNKINITISDKTSTVTTASASTYSNGVFYFVGGAYDRTGNSTFYMNGVSNGIPQSIAGIGVNPDLQTLSVGSSVPIASQYFDGQIGEVAILTFDNISNSNASTMIPLLYQAGYQGVKSLDVRSIKGGGVSIGFWTDFSGTTTTKMLSDKSGNGNNLTGTNVDISDQVRAINLFRR